MKKIFSLAAMTVAVSAILTGCGNPLSSGDTSSGDSGSLTIGSADFTESQLIASIYSQALQDKGVKVSEKFNIGSREVYMAALKDGSIDLVPEYSGALVIAMNAEAGKGTNLADIAKKWVKDAGI